jgi:hypothetical protein
MGTRSPIGAAIACLTILLASPSLGGAQARAQSTSQARLQASLGFAGCAPPERWVPLMIRCEGLPRDASIRITRLAANGGSLGAETFPALEGLPLECPAWTGNGLEALSIELRSGDRALAETRLSARSKPFPGHLVLALGLPTRARLAIASSLMPFEPVLVAAAESSDLPSNGLDYDAISAIAIGSGRIELSPGQKEALLAWLSGGGRLCVAEAGVLEDLGLAAGEGALPYGLGSYAALAPGRAELPGSWREALDLAPYDPEARLGAGSLARAPAPPLPRPGPGGGARAAMTAASAAWIAALLLAAFFGRGRAAPFAAVSAIFLAAVLAGAPALDKAMRRGAAIGARALVLPGSGAAFVRVEAEAYRSPSVLEWAKPGAIGSPRFAYGDEEAGSFGEWRHGLAKASFGLGAGGVSRLGIEAMLEADRWEAVSSLPRPLVAGGPASGAGQPPEIEASSPLAFLAPGEQAAWWTREPGKAWAKSEDAPAWLTEGKPWLLSLRGAKGKVGLLAGRCPAEHLGFTAEGGPLPEIAWAMPLSAGGTR